LKTQLTLLADYNQWMNQQLYQCAAQLSAEQYRQDMRSFFPSMEATLNHIMVADLYWLRRFSTHSSNYKTLMALQHKPIPKGLDDLIYPEFAALQQARCELDELIVRFIEEIPPSDLATAISYATIKGQAHNRCFGSLLIHFFNHQTHHRGQVTTLFSQFGIDYGCTDLLMRIPQFTEFVESK